MGAQENWGWEGYRRREREIGDLKGQDAKETGRKLFLNISLLTKG